MADPGTPKTQKKDLPVEVRMFLAFGLMMLVLFATPYFFKGQQKPAEPPKKETAASKAAPAPAAVEVAKPPAAASSPAAPVTAAAQQTLLVVETDLYRVSLSNRGAVVKSWVLKKYKDNSGKPVELVNAAGAPKVGWAFSWLFKGGQPSTDLNQALFEVQQPDPLTVEYTYSDGKVSAKKSFRFAKSTYKTLFHSEAAENGAPLPHLMVWRGGFGDRTVHSAEATEHTVYFDTSKSKLVVEEMKVAKDGPVSVSGPFGFAGLEDTYFAAVFLGAPGVPVELQTWQDMVAGPVSTAEVATIGGAVGGEGRNTYTFFVGPKDLDVLRGIDPKLEQMVDFGWFWFLAKPLFLALHWTQDVLIPNWGWAIVFVTVIINLLLLPLKFSNLRSMQKMQALQPEIKLINEKYKNVGLRDPKKTQQNEELMALYQKHGVSPMGGCLPLLLQMPFFFAFYKMLTVVIELRGAPWLWVTDLSQPEPSLIRVLPILMVITQFAMQKMTPPSPGMDPNQQRMMYFMPLVLFIPFYSASSGLVLYWLTGNVVGIIQQHFFNKAAAHPAPAAKSSPNKKK
jgi:YidC/Oxa1 family membrane protein insertase